MTPHEKKWLAQLNALLGTELANPYLDNGQIATALEISDSTLHRRIVKLTGSPPLKYIRHWRIQQAKMLLESGDYQTVKTVAHAVGFLKVAYFSEQYKAVFGERPSEVLRKKISQ